MAENREILIWSAQGSWLQRTTREGLRRLSYLGQVSVASLEAFSRQHGIPLEFAPGASSAVIPPESDRS